MSGSFIYGRLRNMTWIDPRLTEDGIMHLKFSKMPSRTQQRK
jgi:hypothetical protein